LKASLALLSALTVLLMPLPASASHQPKDWCSASGDICLNTERVDGVRKLRFGEVERYYSSFTLCVKGPDDVRECHDFNVRVTGSSYGRTVVWRDRYEPRGPGAYTVVWKSDGELIGRRMGFHQ
jgi:hypothetical protein